MSLSLDEVVFEVAESEQKVFIRDWKIHARDCSSALQGSGVIASRFLLMRPEKENFEGALMSQEAVQGMPASWHCS
jgi:hypothetical protein